MSEMDIIELDVEGIETGGGIVIATDIYEYDEDGNKMILAGSED